MKKITSIVIHTTSEGQRLSYTYSEIDEGTGAVMSSGNRESMVVMPIPDNAEALAAIKTLTDYVDGKLQN